MGGRGASSSDTGLKEIKRSIDYNKATGQSSIKDIQLETMYNYVTNKKTKGIRDTLNAVKRSLELNKNTGMTSIKDQQLEKMYNYIKRKR